MVVEGAGRPAAVVLIDGEHYPAVVAGALRELAARYDIRGAAFMGGTEKLRRGGVGGAGDELYGVPVVTGPDPVAAMCLAIDRYRPVTVVDASDEPVLGYRDRFRLVSHALARGVRYEGPDFHFTPPRLERLSSSPSLSIIGTGKRVGKTAVSGYVARLLAAERGRGPGGKIVIVPMGRGGPAQPEVIDGLERVVGVAELLAWSRAGRHASSDHFEDAALSGVTTVGCRRCGGGMAGAVLTSNVAAGALVANGLAPALTVYEGSGAAIPPVATDARLLVAGAGQPQEYVTGYLGTYRLLISDAVILTMAEPPMAGEERLRQMMTAIHDERPDLPVVPVVFRPRPMEPVAGRRAALFCTAPASQRATLMDHLYRVHGCEVVLFSNALSDRTVLAADIERLASLEIDVVLTEIKAAAIDVVAEAADRLGLPVVFVDNVPVEVAPAGLGDLDAVCLEVARIAERRFCESGATRAAGGATPGDSAYEDAGGRA